MMGMVELELTTESQARTTESQSREMGALAEMPELAATPFPFRGKPDFRGFTQDDYDNFSAGVFSRGARLKWFGGRLRFESALKTLEKIGYVCTVTLPHIAEIGNESDGYEEVTVLWYTIFFEAQT